MLHSTSSLLIASILFCPIFCDHNLLAHFNYNQDLANILGNNFHFSKRSLCGQDAFEILLLYCPNGLDMGKRRPERLQTAAFLNDCCDPGCSRARLAWFLCKQERL
ncbi:hypothetical protein L596_010610 [Steinernema carpocapsae]|uniref:Insulin-like domain-containing protein n=1 Tax=Steinernema carpocapsae TaxID=34508 RepID=A0A4U5PJC4_STECR|nr:hypothetical protein L596_010610 [Steinernema carpocapsae]